MSESERMTLAHTRYVVDEFSTLRSLSTALRLDYWKLRKRALRDKWSVEREENVAETRREVVQQARAAIASVAITQIAESLKQLHKVRMSALDLLHSQMEEAKKANPQPVLFEDVLRFEGYDRQPGPDGKVELRPWTRTVRRGLPRPDAKAILDLVIDGMQKLARMSGIAEDADTVKEATDHRFLLE